MITPLSSLTATAAVATIAGVSLLGTHATPAHAAKGSLRECTPSQLSGSLRAGSPGAGQRYATLRLKNVSRATCLESGYVGMQLSNSHLRHQTVATDVVRIDRRDVHTVVLAPAQSASTLLHWEALQGADECSVRATGASVTPPNAYRSLQLRWNLGPVCHPAQIQVTPLTFAG